MVFKHYNNLFLFCFNSLYSIVMYMCYVYIKPEKSKESNITILILV